MPNQGCCPELTWCSLVQVLAAKNVVHFDLKCDNILLSPLKGQEEHLWHPTGSQPPFKVVLADFGTARQYTDSTAAHTRRYACFLTSMHGSQRPGWSST